MSDSDLKQNKEEMEIVLEDGDEVEEVEEVEAINLPNKLQTSLSRKRTLSRRRQTTQSVNSSLGKTLRRRPGGTITKSVINSSGKTLRRPGGTIFKPIINLGTTTLAGLKKRKKKKTRKKKK